MANYNFKKKQLNYSEAELPKASAMVTRQVS
ncbi:hypothetical protein Desmer_0717 [Desulfosporosinus meridiei DSM 13257]|uniref:Uncharacterized protein n=1 Tax=Desulfosporosinus meridiei (strain ATCC BAA-275 / DSM 13257 / KCTC 12902 / NCIMB 13706 / S10) TaxID=768704 RepID=J7IRD9_DESMD|nr:hypothetical protein Desmer_0717 [Desulfosporosinus meridiei DSM 13257]